MHSANFSDDLEKLLQRHNLSVRERTRRRVCCHSRRTAPPRARMLLTNLHSGSCARPSRSRHRQRSSGQSRRAERRGLGCCGCSQRGIDVQRIAQGARNLSRDGQAQRAARRKSIQVPNAQDARVHSCRNQGGSRLSHRYRARTVLATHAQESFYVSKRHINVAKICDLLFQVLPTSISRRRWLPSTAAWEVATTNSRTPT